MNEHSEKEGAAASSSNAEHILHVLEQASNLDGYKSDACVRKVCSSPASCPDIDIEHIEAELDPYQAAHHPQMIRRRRHSHGVLAEAEKLLAASCAGDIGEEPLQQQTLSSSLSQDALPGGVGEFPLSVDDEMRTQQEQRLFSIPTRRAPLDKSSSMPYPALAGFSLGASSRATAASRQKLLQMQFAGLAGAYGGAQPPPPPTSVGFVAKHQPRQVKRFSAGAFDPSVWEENLETTSTTTTATITTTQQGSSDSARSLLFGTTSTTSADSARSLGSSSSAGTSRGSVVASTSRRGSICSIASRRGSIASRRGSVGSFTTAARQRRLSVGSCRKEVTVIKAGKSARRPSGDPLSSVDVVAVAPVSEERAADGGKSASTRKKVWKKPKDKPKRPLSAYNLFFQSERERIIGAEACAASDAKRRQNRRRHRKTHGKIGFAALAQTIAAKWKDLDPEEKQVFDTQAEVERARYRKELDAWKLVQTERRIAEQRAELKDLQERWRWDEATMEAGCDRPIHCPSESIVMVKQQLALEPMEVGSRAHQRMHNNTMANGSTAVHPAPTPSACHSSKSSEVAKYNHDPRVLQEKEEDLILEPITNDIWSEPLRDVIDPPCGSSAFTDKEREEIEKMLSPPSEDMTRMFQHPSDGTDTRDDMLDVPPSFSLHFSTDGQF